MQIEDKSERDKIVKSTCGGCGKYRVLFSDGNNNSALCRECIKQGKGTKYKRNCLKCGKLFHTYVKYNHVCSVCKLTVEWQTFENDYKTWRR